MNQKLKKAAIEQLQKKEIGLRYDNQNLDLLRTIMNTAFPDIDYMQVEGVATHYSADQPYSKGWNNHFSLSLEFKGMDYFLDGIESEGTIETQTLVDIHKRMAENSTYGYKVENSLKYGITDTMMKFTTQCGQDVFLSPKDIECISQFQPKVKEIEMTEAEFENFMDSKNWSEATKHANKMMFAGILKSETVTQYSYPVKLSQ